MKTKVNKTKLEKAFNAIEGHDLKIPTWKDADGFRVIGVKCPDSVWEDLKNFKPKMKGQTMKTRVKKDQNSVSELKSKIVLREGCWVSVAENNGKVEVVLSKDSQRIRLLGDKDGIHIGTIVKE